MNKSELRDLLKIKRNSISSENKQIFEQKIRLNILDYINNRRFKKIAGYSPIDSEVDLLPTLLELGSEVSLPYIDGDLKFSIFTKTSKLVKGRFSLIPELIQQTTPELVFVPLLGFDSSFNRIGYGKGFYDSYIASHPNATYIGIGFDAQKCIKIPTEPHDQKLDGVITESGNVLKG